MENLIKNELYGMAKSGFLYVGYTLTEIKTLNGVKFYTFAKKLHEVVIAEWELPQWDIRICGNFV